MSFNVKLGTHLKYLFKKCYFHNIIIIHKIYIKIDFMYSSFVLIVKRDVYLCFRTINFKFTSIHYSSSTKNNIKSMYLKMVKR